MTDPFEILGSRDLTAIDRALKHSWDIPPAIMAVLPKQIAEMAAGLSKSPKGEPWSMRSRMKAAQLLVSFFNCNIAAGTLDLQYKKFQQPGDLSAHATAVVVEKIVKAARDKFGQEEVSEFEREILETVLQAARLAQGTDLLPSELEDEVRAMDDTIPHGE